MRWIALLLLPLAACNTTQPRIVTREVKVPVVQPCVSERVARAPTYPDTDDALREAPDAAARYSLVSAGRLLRDQRLAEIEPVLEACRGSVQ